MIIFSFSSASKYGSGWEYPLKQGKEAFAGNFGSWVLRKNQLELPVKNPPDSRTNLWLLNEFCNFEIEFDFVLDRNTNSGLFIRTGNTANPVQTGIEIQLRDDYGKDSIDAHFCGSIYECSAARVNAVKPPGEWNKLEVVCAGAEIRVILNKILVNRINLDDWTIPGKNPDGTMNKFRTAYKDMVRCGSIGFQDHGGKIQIKDLRIRAL